MIGRAIGTYELEGLLGEGGIGQVYAAQDKALGRRVAIKMLRPELSRDRNFVDRFNVEAKSLGNLNHSNITTLYALHAEGEEAFMVMELVHGYTLEAVLARAHRLTLRDSLAFLAQTIAGIRYAHRRGVIHRDIKPANLMVTDDGVVKIMDFGIARVQGSQHLTRVGEFCGTFVYASPEQIRGEEVDERSDLYSLAIVFYRMLAGTAPFTSDNEYALMTAQLQTPPPPLTGQVPDLDAATEEVLMRALAKRPDDRFASVEEFGRVVGALALRGESIDILQQLYARVFESGDVEETRIVTTRQPAAVDRTMPSNRPERRRTDADLLPSRPRAPAYPEPQSDRSDWRLGGTEVLSSLPASRHADPEPWSSARDFPARAAELPASVRHVALPATRRGRGRVGWIMAGALAVPLALGGSYYAYVAIGPTQLADSAVVPSQSQTVQPPPSPPIFAAPVHTDAPPAPIEAAKAEPSLPPTPAPIEVAKAEPRLPPAPAPIEVKVEPRLPPAPAPIEAAKAEPRLPPAPAPIEAAKAEPRLPPPPAPIEPAKAKPRLPPAPTPIEAARAKPRLPPEPSPAPIEAKAEAPPVPPPAPAPIEVVKAEPPPMPPPAPAPTEAVEEPPPPVPRPAPAPIEVVKAEPPPPAPLPAPAPIEAVTVEPQLPSPQVPDSPLPGEPVPGEPMPGEPRSAADRPDSDVQVATTQPQSPAEPAPSLGPVPPSRAPQPEGEPDLLGRVTGAKRFDEIEVAAHWIKLYGIVDRARGPQAAQRIQALLRYVKPAHNVLVCYRKAADTYRCYADGEDIARLALRDGMAQLAPNAPPEYRSLLAQQR